MQSDESLQDRLDEAPGAAIGKPTRQRWADLADSDRSDNPDNVDDDSDEDDKDIAGDWAWFWKEAGGIRDATSQPHDRGWGGHWSSLQTDPKGPSSTLRPRSRPRHTTEGHCQRQRDHRQRHRGTQWGADARGLQLLRPAFGLLLVLDHVLHDLRPPLQDRAIVHRVFF